MHISEAQVRKMNWGYGHWSPDFPLSYFLSKDKANICPFWFWAMYRKCGGIS